MSAFIAPVHFWMYDKIINLRNLEERLVKLFNSEDELIKFSDELADKYGDIDRDKPLENIIDHRNIHGWLQARVDIVEERFAKLVTHLLGLGVSLNDIIDAAREHAKATAQNIDIDATKHQGSFIKSYKYNQPKEVFATLNTYLLEGMPCDRVSLPIEDSPNEFIWETTECIHHKYWQNVNGDIANHYKIRNEWINSFVENLPKKFSYERFEDNGRILNIIKALEE